MSDLSRLFRSSVGYYRDFSRSSCNNRLLGSFSWVCRNPHTVPSSPSAALWTDPQQGPVVLGQLVPLMFERHCPGFHTQKVLAVQVLQRKLPVGTATSLPAGCSSEGDARGLAKCEHTNQVSQTLGGHMRSLVWVQLLQMVCMTGLLRWLCF